MYCIRSQSNLWRNGLIYGKRLVRFQSDYIKRTFHHRIVTRQSHQLSQKQIEQIHLKEEENPNNKIEPIAIVIPVSIPNTNPLVSSIVGNTTVTEADLKHDVKTVKKNKTEDLKWTVTPSEDLSRLGKHYLMLSKSRLTCKSAYFRN